MAQKWFCLFRPRFPYSSIFFLCTAMVAAWSCSTSSTATDLTFSPSPASGDTTSPQEIPDAPRVFQITKNIPLIIPHDAGIMIWDITRIPDREKTRIEFPHLVRFKGYWYSSFREGEIHGNHISGRGRVIRSTDGVHWETAALFESANGDVRDPRLSVTSDRKLMLNSSIKFIEEAAPYRTIDGQIVQRQSVTWLSDDGETWSDPYACPTGINTWRWDVAWHGDYGYSIGYSGKDANGTLYRTKDGKSWTALKKDLFPGGHGNEAALTFGHDGTAYVLLRAGLDARVALGFSRPPYDQDWQWQELNAYWDGPVNRQPVRDIPGFERDLGGPEITTLADGRLLGAGRVRGAIRIAVFLIDPENAVLTRVAGVENGSSYPGIIEHNGDIWLSYIGHVSGEGPIYLSRIRLPDRDRMD